MCRRRVNRPPSRLSILSTSCEIEHDADMVLQLSTRAATELVGQLSHTEDIKGAIRDNGGILALMRCACTQRNLVDVHVDTTLQRVRCTVASW